MPRCENCGTDWTSAHLCSNPPLGGVSGILKPWGQFTDEELAVFLVWSSSMHDMVVVPDSLRDVDEHLAVQLVAEIKSRQSGRTT